MGRRIRGRIAWVLCEIEVGKGGGDEGGTRESWVGY